MLPSPYREQALNNAKSFYRNGSFCTINENRTSLRSAISEAFSWGDSIQGDMYWADVARKYPIESYRSIPVYSIFN